MFKNMKIGTRLFIGFGMVLLLIMTGGGGFTTYLVTTLSGLTTKLHDHPLTVSNAVRDVDINIIKMHRSMKDVASARDTASLEAAVSAVSRYEQDVYAQFGIIEERFLGDKRDVENVKQLFIQWKPIRDEVIRLVRQGKKDEAAEITKGKGYNHIVLLENKMKTLTDFAANKADEFLENARTQAKRAYILTFSVMIVLVIFGQSLAFVISRSITRPLKVAIAVADQVSEGDLEVEFEATSKDEVGQVLTSMKNMIRYIRNVAGVAEKVSNKNLQVKVTPKSHKDILNHSFTKMVANLQTMIAENESARAEAEQQTGAMKQQAWLKDGVSQLSTQLSGEPSLLELCQKAVSFTARYVNAGHGVLYIYDAEKELLKLYGSFAFTERDKLSNEYKLGKGVIGQVALERSPILLKHITRSERVITTGTSSKAPLSTYTLPLIYEDNLYGVFELASFEPFDAITREFLNEVNRVIATALFSTAQRERVQELLELSQQATREAEQAANEAEQAANEAKQAREDAEQKSREVQQANAQL